ncbi:MAG TPA: ABC transporter permease [Candidatus Xenobia bacterium]|nr:ABC transporter permease [Candidatus Xenobia bacterium]
MRWNRLVAMARKESLQILRDPRSLTIALTMPIVMMFFYGYGVNLDYKHVPLYVLDREGSQPSQDLLKRFQASEYFELVRVVDNYPALVEALDAGKCQLAVVIPHDFSQRLASGRPASVQVLVDATDDNGANIATGYAEAVVGAYAQEVQRDWLQRQGTAAAPAPPIAVEARTWFNEELESKDFIIPGIVAMVMAVIGAFLTSLTIAREWERGTMEGLIATPVTRLEIMVGKLAPYFVIGMLDTALCTLLAIAWFKVPFRGDWSTLLLSSALFLLGVLGQGYFISVVAKSQLAASQAALVSTLLPAFLLSGFLFAIEQMPAIVQTISRVIPARYYVSIMKSVFLKGTPPALLVEHLAALAIFSVLVMGLATRAFHKRLI